MIPIENATDSDLLRFTTMLRRIAGLVSLDETDDYGVLRPTKYAIRRTLKVLMQVYMLGHVFPRENVTTDEKGGLRIEWPTENWAFCFVIPAKEGGQEYFYHEQGGIRNIDDWLQNLEAK